MKKPKQKTPVAMANTIITGDEMDEQSSKKKNMVYRNILIPVWTSVGTSIASSHFAYAQFKRSIKNFL